MKPDKRFEEIQIDKNKVCPGCGYTIQAGSIAHRNIAEDRIYCMSCYKEMRSLD